MTRVWNGFYGRGGKLNKEFCAASVTSPGVWSSHQCSRKVAVQEEGHGWCRQHAPSAQKKRDEAREAKYQAEQRENNARWAKQAAFANVAQIAIDHFDQKASFDDLEAAVAKYRELKEKHRNEV